MRTSDRLPPECREEIRHWIENAEDVQRFLKDERLEGATRILRWVLGDDGK